jgi:tetratricopeptide (TPR) repeat protein
VAYAEAGRTAEALPRLEATLRARESKLGPDHPDTLVSRNNLAMAYLDSGCIAEALPRLEATLRARESKLGPDHPDTLVSRNSLAMAYGAAGREAEAIALLEATLRARESKLGPDHPDTLDSRNDLGVAFWRVGRLDQSIPLFERVMKQMAAKLGPDHPQTVNTMANLGVNYLDARRSEEGARLMEEALRRARGRPDALAKTAWVGPQLAAVYQALGRWDQAEPLLRDSLARQRATEPPESPALAALLAQVGMALLQQGKYSEAEPTLRECLKIREAKLPDAWSRFNTMSQLGRALLGQDRYAEAEPLIVGGYVGLKAREATMPPPARPRLPEAAERVVALYEAWGKRGQAANWRHRLGVADLPPEVFARPKLGWSGRVRTEPAERRGVAFARLDLVGD